MDLKDLKKFVSAHRPFVMAATAYIKDISFHSNILKEDSICGATTQSFSFLYDSFSIPYQYTKFENYYSPVLIENHFVPSVNLDNFGFVSTDAAYYQFIKDLCLPSSDMPSEDILIISKDNLDVVLNGLVSLHSKLKSSFPPLG